MHIMTNAQWSWSDNAPAIRNGFPIHLSARQREVLLLLCAGLPNKLIARRLGLTDATVKCHVASVLRSLNVSSRLEAVLVAIELGLVQPSAQSSAQGKVPNEVAHALAAWRFVPPAGEPAALYASVVSAGGQP